MTLNVKTSSKEYISAETMLIDEGGVELLIDGEIELGGSFESLDNFELAYRVLPEHFEHEDERHADNERELAKKYMKDNDLETSIWIFSQELAERRGYSK